MDRTQVLRSHLRTIIQVLSMFALKNNSGTVRSHLQTIQLLSTFTRTDSTQVLSTFALTNNSGTVCVHTYGQDSSRIQAELQTTHAQPTAMIFTRPVFSECIFLCFLQSNLPIFQHPTSLLPD